jgi:hypothetical protein
MVRICQKKKHLKNQGFYLFVLKCSPNHLQTDSAVHDIKTGNKDCLCRPVVNLSYLLKDAYCVLIKINSLCHSLRSITN